MKTTYVIQKRHLVLGREWGTWSEWHDRGESSPHTRMDEAITEVRRLILNADTTQYRLVERTDLEIDPSEHP